MFVLSEGMAVVGGLIRKRRVEKQLQLRRQASATQEFVRCSDALVNDEQPASDWPQNAQGPRMRQPALIAYRVTLLAYCWSQKRSRIQSIPGRRWIGDATGLTLRARHSGKRLSYRCSSACA